MLLCESYGVDHMVGCFDADGCDIERRRCASNRLYLPRCNAHRRKEVAGMLLGHSTYPFVSPFIHDLMKKLH